MPASKTNRKLSDIFRDIPQTWDTWLFKIVEYYVFIIFSSLDEAFVDQW